MFCNCKKCYSPSAKDVTVSSATLQLNPDTMKETSKMEHSDVHTVKCKFKDL